MINILVKLEAKDFRYLDEFESFAVKIIEKYQGRILSPFEIEETIEGKREAHNKSINVAYRLDLPSVNP